jgi:hypothetical protein
MMATKMAPSPQADGQTEIIQLVITWRGAPRADLLRLRHNGSLRIRSDRVLVAERCALIISFDAPKERHCHINLLLGFIGEELHDLSCTASRDGRPCHPVVSSPREEHRWEIDVSW